jgi:D-aminopeptidase
MGAVARAGKEAHVTTSGTYESFPARIVLLSIMTALSIYGLGAYLLGRLAIPLAVLFDFSRKLVF